jgi:modulator of drug activity B
VKKALVINTHHPYESSPGRLNAALAERIESVLRSKGYEVRSTRSAEAYDVAEEAEKHRWADVIILQGPVYWMGFPWSFKKYQDEVYGLLSGALYDGDGRHRDRPELQYGTGGLGQDKKYMLSLTYNAPRELFDNPSQYFLQGKGVDDMFLPTHLNFRFMGMEPLQTFICYDVHKDPDTENDFKRLERHLERHF